MVGQWLSGEIAGPILVGTLGLLIGSYVANLSVRMPAGRSNSTGRSACDACARPLTAIELIPIAGFLLSRGRCRTCGAAIDRRYPLIEIACALIGAIAASVAPGWTGVATAMAGWVLVLLAVLDLEHFWLPDRLTLPLGMGGLIAGLWVDPPWLDRVVGAAAGWAALAGIAWLYARVRGRQGMGGGDPKLLGAIGAWVGWQLLPLVLLSGAALGLIAVAVASFRGQRVEARTRLPFGTCLAIGGWPLILAAGPLS